jgi:Cu-Zn family superoxide dismutase
MHPRRTVLALAGLAAALLIPVAAHADKAPKVVVAIHASDGTDVGTVTFTQKKSGLNIHINAKNLPVGTHAVHIHQNAQCDPPDFKSAGGHFNPDGKQHGMNNPMGHHNGDLPGNLTIGENHTGEVTFTVGYLTMNPTAANSIFANGGTSIIIHEHADDMMTDPTGNAGNRIACGVITPAATVP